MQYPLASVILPFHNSACFLQDAIDSVRRQTYANWELICVDDDSDDDGPAIVESYTEEDSRIRLLFQEKRGAGAARNFGMFRSNGALTMFLDADDLLRSDAIERLVRVFEATRCDVVFYGPKDNADPTWAKSGEVVPFAVEKIELHSSGLQYLISESKKRVWSPGAPLQALRTDFLKTAQISFPEDLAFEDNLFSLALKLSVGSVAVLDEALYGVREFPNSLTRSPKTAQDVMSMLHTHSRGTRMFQNSETRNLEFFEESREFVLWGFLRQARQYYLQSAAVERQKLNIWLRSESTGLAQETVDGFAKVANTGSYFLLAAKMRLRLRKLRKPRESVEGEWTP